MISRAMDQRILAGPPITGDPEPLDEHRARLGPLPGAHENGDVISALEASGLLGRGGAGFPVGRKWRAMANRPGGRAVVLANGAEGEPPSAKDSTLMASRPHLVIDGTVLAAEAVGADEIILFVGEEHEAALVAMRRAMQERRGEIRVPMRLVTAPVGYVVGEATAAVHYVNSADARPTTTPPRVSEQGVGGQPTLVQNVESLAAAALIARFGADWYRSAGRLACKGTTLITVSGAVRRPGVREIEIGTTLAEVLTAAGVDRDRIRAVVLGGYFGTWARMEDAWDLPLDPDAMRGLGLTFGCGIVGALGMETCGVAAAADIMAFMAHESAGQCGPCVYGLQAISDSTRRIARGHAHDTELEDLDRWVAQTAGRGACHHPDGAVQQLESALNAFGDEFHYHVRTGQCSVTGSWARGA